MHILLQPFRPNSWGGEPFIILVYFQICGLPLSLNSFLIKIESVVVIWALLNISLLLSMSNPCLPCAHALLIPLITNVKWSICMALCPRSRIIFILNQHQIILNFYFVVCGATTFSTTALNKMAKLWHCRVITSCWMTWRLNCYFRLSYFMFIATFIMVLFW